MLRCPESIARRLPRTHGTTHRHSTDRGRNAMTTRRREVRDRSRDLLNRSLAMAADCRAQPGQLETAPNRGRTPTAEAPGHTPQQLEQHSAAESVESSETALAGICSSLAMRDLNLVDSLLAQLEQMESSEEDHNRLGELYRLDHLATRLRRNAENLRVLSGKDSGETSSGTSSLVDVIRAGMSSIENYARVSIGRTVSLGIVAFAADDISRLLSELLDNATMQSPPDSQVRISAHLTEAGSILIRIEDDGIGLPTQRLAALNERLHADPVLDDAAVRHMGLAVVRRIAARHELRTNLESRSPHGTTATVLLPAHVVCELNEDTWSGTQTVVLPRTGQTTASDSPQQAASSDPTPINPSSRATGGHRSTPTHSGSSAAAVSSASAGPSSGSSESPAAPSPPSAARQAHLLPAEDQSVGGTTHNGL